MDRTRRIAQQIRNAIPQTRIGNFNDRVRRSVARGQYDVRKSAIFPRDQILSLRESSQNGGSKRALALLAPLGLPWTTDVISRLSAVAKISIDAEEEP